MQSFKRYLSFFRCFGDNNTHFGYADPRSAGHVPNMVITNDGDVAIGTATANTYSNYKTLTIGGPDASTGSGTSITVGVRSRVRVRAAV